MKYVPSYMAPRKKMPTTIRYILVSTESPIVSPFIPPRALINNCLTFVKQCPKDIVELFSSLFYYEVAEKFLIEDCVNFEVLRVDYLKELIENKDNISTVELIFIDTSIKEYESIVRSLIPNNSQVLRYFHFFNGNVEEQVLNFDALNVVTSAFDFITQLLKRRVDLVRLINMDLEVNLSVNLDHHKYVKPSLFKPTFNNFHLINRLIGNFGYQLDSELDDEEKERKDAEKNYHTFARQERIIQQISIIDIFKNYLYEDNRIKNAFNTDPLFAPLVIILPYHNPDWKKNYSGAPYLKYLLSEQSKNYTIISTWDKEETLTDKLYIIEKQILAAVSEFIQVRLKYLDDISYLHASFTSSPIIRLPLLGKSINRELSFFKADNFTNMKTNKTRRRIKNTIKEFGMKVESMVLSDTLRDMLKLRNSQIVAITDLPIEWVFNDGIPLSFTHDITRMPETLMHGLISTFRLHQEIEYSISKDILHKTLVIFGNNEDEFKKAQSYVEELSNQKGFSTARCNGIDDVLESIEKNKPHFIIFDCHGGYDKTTQSTFLWIGKEKLTGELIIEKGVVAPLVFLSACGTSPTYGVTNSIANAFLEAGAMSITTTYIPVSIHSASILYVPLLFQLESASRKGRFKNWLQFVSYCIRTSSIGEAYLSFDYSSDNFKEITATIFAESQIFLNRRALYYNIDKRMAKMNPKKTTVYSELVPEYLFYSNLGRGDLIMFEEWVRQYKELNNNATHS